MKKKKKLIVGLCSMAAVLLLTGSVVFVAKKTAGKAVKVVPVSELGNGYWNSDVNISGMITSNASQEVRLNDKQVVDEVYVKEGDTVKAGTPLLSFDMTMTSLNLESEKLNKEGLEIQKRGLEAEISRLKKKTPVTHTSSANRDNMEIDGTRQNSNGGFLRLSVTSELTVPPTSEPTVTTIPEPTETTTPEPTVTTTPEPSVTTTPEPTVTATPEPTVTPTPESTETPGETPIVTPTPYPPTTPSVTPPAFTLPAYECIDENSKYLGTGTKEDPRYYLGKQTDDYKVRVTGKFLNTAEEKGLIFFIALRQGDKLEGELTASIFINGARLKTYDASKTYVINLYPVDDIVAEPEETPGESEIPDEGTGDDLGDLPIPDEVLDGYTKEELNHLISEKQKELKSLNLDIRQCDLRIAQIEKSLKDQKIISTVNGIVKSVGDPEKGAVNGKAFLVVESTEGLYVQGSISELMLGQIKEGTILNGTSYETGMMFEAEIKEISPYPLDGNNYDGYGNSNASYYPFTAYIAEGDGLKNNEYVGFTTTIGEDETGETIYMDRSFVRSENGSYYVYIADDKNRLKRQDIVIGKKSDAYTVEIRSGLTKEDRIAFPYGKNVKEGASVKDADISELYM